VVRALPHNPKVVDSQELVLNNWAEGRGIAEGSASRSEAAEEAKIWVD
jgi:hypothetical protein